MLITYCKIKRSIFDKLPIFGHKIKYLPQDFVMRYKTRIEAMTSRPIHMTCLEGLPLKILYRAIMENADRLTPETRKTILRKLVFNYYKKLNDNLPICMKWLCSDCLVMNWGTPNSGPTHCKECGAYWGDTGMWIEGALSEGQVKGNGSEIWR